MLLVIWFGVSVYCIELEIDDFEKFLVLFIVVVGFVGMIILFGLLIVEYFFEFDLEVIMYFELFIFGFSFVFLGMLIVVIVFYFFCDVILRKDL